MVLPAKTIEFLQQTGGIGAFAYFRKLEKQKESKHSIVAQ